MAVTGQISIARVGRTVQIFEQTSDIIDVLDPNASPSLQEGDHVTLYPGDFRQDLQEAGGIRIPGVNQNEASVFLTILPGATVGYGTVSGTLEERYEYITGNLENIADLNISQQYTTESETQSPRVRIYPQDTQTSSGVDVPFSGFKDLDSAAAAAKVGDTIVVFPGKYEPEKNLYVEGVNWQFMDGAVVEFTREFDSSQYPHALFDDLRTVNGELDEGGKNCNIYGDGEFIIGTENEQPNLGNTNFDGTTYADVGDWDGWHMYSVLSVNSSSSVNFEAKKIRMKDYADAAVKISAGNNVDIDVEELEMAQSLENSFSINGVTQVPSFSIINGTVTSLESGDVSVNVDEFNLRGKTNENNSVYFMVGLNNDVDEREPFQGSINVSVGETNMEDPQGSTKFINLLGGISPTEFTVEDTDMLRNSGGIVISGSIQSGSINLPVTKFVVKDCKLSTENTVDQYPLDLRGNSSGFDIHLDNTWFITGEDLDFSKDLTTYAITNNTGDTDFDIKVYGSCFADAPMQNYKKILHDELNDITWSEDVELLS